MKKTKILSLAPFAIFFGFIPYVLLQRASGDPRFQHALILDEKNMYLVESLVMYGAGIGIMIVWMRALWRLYRSRQYGWLAAVFFVWPLTAIYVWKEE